MAFEKICTLDDVWEGEMSGFTTADGTQILVVGLPGGEVRAVQSKCPHQEFSLLQARLDKHVLICRAHLWQFDLRSGDGINPRDCALAVYPTRIEGDDVLVDVASIRPKYSHT